MRFRSRDRWPLWLWLFSLFITGSLAIAVEAAIGNTVAWVVLLIQILGLSWISLSTPLHIDVDSTHLRVGGASIERRFITHVTALSSHEMALIRGRNANPLCWMALRFWVSTGVKIEINDPLDPAPYWLVSAKRAPALAEALSPKN
jgi:hypothetical protein